MTDDRQRWFCGWTDVEADWTWHMRGDNAKTIWVKRQGNGECKRGKEGKSHREWAAEDILIKDFSIMSLTNY